MKTKMQFIPSGQLQCGKKQFPKVVAALRSIEKRFGILTPSLVVAEAEPKSSPLHKLFCWDNDSAARQFREWQARKVIASVSVTFKDSGGNDQVCRAFVNVQSEPAEEGEEEASAGQGYVSMDVACRSQNYKGQVLEYAHRQLLMWKNKFGSFKEFFSVCQEIEKIRT